MPVLLVYSNFFDHSPPLWNWRRPMWSEGGGCCWVVIMATALGLRSASLNLCQVQTSPRAELSWWSECCCPPSGGWGLRLAPRSLCWGWPAAISYLCLKWSICIPTDRKCCRSLWFSCLLEVHVVLFFSVHELFMGKWKVDGGFSVTFSFLWQISFIYSVLQCVVYSICSDTKQLPRFKPEIAAAILECLCKLTLNPPGWRALLKM